LSHTDGLNHTGHMAKNGKTNKSRAKAAALARENAKNSKAARDRTSAAQAESGAPAKENLFVAHDHSAVRHDHSRSPEKTSGTESETESSAQPTPVKKQTQAEVAAEIYESEIEGDRNEIPVDRELVNLNAFVDEQHASDKRLKQEHRMKLILDLRTSNYVKQQCIYAQEDKLIFFEAKARQFKQDKDKAESEKKILTEKLKVKSEDYAELNHKYQQKLSQLTGKRKRINANDQNKELMDLIETHCKGLVFSKCKFVNSADQEENLAKLVLHYGNIPEEHRKDKQQFIRAYSGHMKKVIFERRSYVQTEIRKVFLKSYEKKCFHPFPTVEQLKKCLTRDIETDQEYEIFVFYCEEILGKMVGASEWQPKIRCFTTISDAIRQGTKKVPLISPGDEAFAVLLVDNCLERWTQEARKEAGHPTNPTNEPKTKKKNMDGKYTSSNGGQQTYGGWNTKGLVMFNELTALSEAARATDKCREVEDMCLQIMRNKNKITAKTWEEQCKGRSKKKPRDDETDEIGRDEEQNGVVLARVEMVTLSDDDDS
jgi:hypothetical protein